MKQAIVEIKKMSLMFPTRVHRSTTVRDVFVRSLTKPFETFFKAPDFLDIIRDLNLEIYRGDRVALIGVNGVGKTSLCRAIAGFYRPTTGTITIHGRVRAIFDTMVGIYPDLTGRENASILVDCLYPNLANREESIKEALEFTELGKFLDTPFKYYSNGMQTRLCLAILTIEPTDLLILDEVFEGADQFFREKIAKRVLNVIEQSGAVVFVSHSEDQLRRVCNRAIFIRDGGVVFDGPMDEGLKVYRDSYQPHETKV
jgi:ABC-type polysaccharide/polyol phosphate transport system ATPase subunit